MIISFAFQKHNQTDKRTKFLRDNRVKNITLDNYLNKKSDTDTDAIKKLCEDFTETTGDKYVFGTNVWAKSIADNVDITAFIDEVATEKTFLDRPVIKLDDLPHNSLVASSVVLGRPNTSLKKISSHGSRGIDYFALKKFSGLPLIPVLYLDLFKNELEQHRNDYERIFLQLADEESRKTIADLLNFRISADLFFMKDYRDRQLQQYFEPFLNLGVAGESFADIGAFDGSTSAEFIRRYSGYYAIHVFEPEPVNMLRVKKRLAANHSIYYYDQCLSNKKETLNFRSDGSSSCIDVGGDITVQVDALDNVIQSKLTFLKMDIEGGELNAIEGAKKLITKYHPTMAICVYHRSHDLRTIPEKVLSIRKDYEIYLRHYTEGVTETVMYFVPKR